MRIKSSLKPRKSLLRIAGAVLLASAATGCSSDATRFSGLFSDTDSLTTASIPQGQASGAYGQAQLPRGEIASASPGIYRSENLSANQPYSAPSVARSASAPSMVQRSDLSPATEASVNRQQAVTQPFPAAQAPGDTRVAADNLTTGTVARPSGWSTVNAPTVALRPGETAATLSRRYGVPEQEILRANGGKLVAGQSVTIPTFGPSSNSAKVAAGEINLNGKAPLPEKQTEQKVAVLPGASRDKGLVEPAKITPPAGGRYTVKSGDTLTKIARANGISVDQLKAANGLANENIRIGQVLSVVPSATPAAQPVSTASAPVKPAETQKSTAVSKVETAAAEANPVKAADKPVETASVSEAAVKTDVTSVAPQSTGIDKYRWPVSGAVISGFGQNVDGARNDGINISVPEGTPIKAAENGVVIYAGNGLKQLGNTVLVRHDDGKVTVYGHASDLNVSRGQKVTRGQTIASSGMSGDAKRPLVHFEVRKDATPVNPITFLE